MESPLSVPLASLSCLSWWHCVVETPPQIEPWPKLTHLFQLVTFEAHELCHFLSLTGLQAIVDIHWFGADQFWCFFGHIFYVHASLWAGQENWTLRRESGCLICGFSFTEDATATLLIMSYVPKYYCTALVIVMLLARLGYTALL